MKGGSNSSNVKLSHLLYQEMACLNLAQDISYFSFSVQICLLAAKIALNSPFFMYVITRERMHFIFHPILMKLLFKISTHINQNWKALFLSQHS